MKFFRDFPLVTYQFGSNGAVLGQQSFQDISAYVDVIDQFKDNISYYSFYHILDGDRPDTISSDFYGVPYYHWTVWLMNDHIRESGWPLTRAQLEAKLQENYTGCVIQTRTDFFGTAIEGTNNTGPLLNVGDTLTGSISGASAVVSKLDPDNGQIFLSTSASFLAGEAATWRDSEDVLQTLVVVSCVLEYNAVDHYEDGNGEVVDIDPTNGPGALINEVTISDMYSRRNEELKIIRVIRPEHVEQIVNAYQLKLQE